jgi:hypothetical protein
LRKHKRLIFVTVQPYILNAVVLGASGLGPVVSEVRRLENETVLLEIAAGAPQPQIQTTLTIAFDEIDLGVHGEPT